MDGRMAACGKHQFETDEAVRRRQQLESQRDEAQQQGLDRGLLAQFRAKSPGTHNVAEQRTT